MAFVRNSFDSLSFFFFFFPPFFLLICSFRSLFSYKTTVWERVGRGSENQRLDLHNWKSWEIFGKINTQARLIAIKRTRSKKVFHRDKDWKKNLRMYRVRSRPPSDYAERQRLSIIDRFKAKHVKTKSAAWITNHSMHFYFQYFFSDFNVFIWYPFIVLMTSNWFHLILQ